MTEQELYNAVKNLCSRYNRRGLDFLRYNRKTLVSMDISNSCPREEQGNPCPYCYKALLYKLYGKTGFEQGKQFQRNFALDLRFMVDLEEFGSELRKLLDRAGLKDFSIRLFSLGDIKEEYLSFWRKVLSLLRQRFKVHAITKQYSIIKKLARNLDQIQLSIDSQGTTDHAEAYRMRRRNPGKYKVRAVILNPSDSHLADRADIITLYHGHIIKGIETFRTNHRTYLKLAQRWAEEHPEKVVCCTTGKCTSCGQCHPKQ